MKQPLATRLLLRDINTNYSPFFLINNNSSNSNMDHYDDDHDNGIGCSQQATTRTTTAMDSSNMILMPGNVSRRDSISTTTNNNINNNIGHTSTSRRSQSIPLPRSHVHRTQSEVQLCEDMETAERRDLNMFYRLVNGIRERQMQLLVMNDLPNPERDTWPILQQHHQPRRHNNPPYSNYDPTTQYCLGSREAESCVAHIIHTHNDNNSSNCNSDHSNSNNVPGCYAMPASATLQQALRNHGSASDHRHHPKEDNVLSEWWSLSGFDEEVAPLSSSSSSRHHLHQQSSFTMKEESCVAKDDEDDEGIFDLDF